MRESVICELSLCSGETKYTIHWKFPEIKISWKLLNRQDIWILERKGWAWHLVSPTYCTFSPFKTQPDPSVQTAQWEECLPASSVQGWMGVKTQDRPGLFKLWSAVLTCPHKEGRCVLTSPVTSCVHLSGRKTPDETHPSPQGAFRDQSKCTRKRKVTQMVGREAKETAHNRKWEKVLEGCWGEGVLSWDPRVRGGTDHTGK